MTRPPDPRLCKACWRDADVCDAFAVANHLLSELGFQFVGIAA